MINNTSATFSNEVITEVKNIEEEGQRQFTKFFKERLVMGKVEINATIKKITFPSLILI